MARTLTLLGAGLLFAAAAGAPAQAQSVADFYRGKTVNMLIGVGVGGEYDLQARLVARHIGKHIPGNPNVVPQNMVGAGGINMANNLYNTAPRDGTDIGMMGNNFPASQAVGGKNVKFDAGKMQWLGTIAPVVETMAVWHTAGVKIGRRSAQAGDGCRRLGPRRHHLFLSDDDERVPRHEVQDRHRLSRRQPDQPGHGARRGAGAQQHLVELEGDAAAMDQGQADLSWWRRPDHARSDLDAPSVEELARTPDDRLTIELIVSGTQLGRPFATTPDVPADRLAALRDAFRATMKDPEFLKDAAQMNFEVDPVYGEAMQKIVEKILSTPKNSRRTRQGVPRVDRQR